MSDVGSTFIGVLSIFVIASRFKALGIFMFGVDAEVGMSKDLYISILIFESFWFEHCDAMCSWDLH